MAVKDKNWGYMPVTGYDITNAFKAAGTNLDNTLKALEDYMDVKTEIATGEAQNALSQAEDAFTVNSILQEALGNSWIDNSALSEQASKRKDRFFDEDITEQELIEKLINGEHSRDMDEKNYVISAARLNHDILNSDRNYDISLRNLALAEEELGIKKQEADNKALLNKYNSLYENDKNSSEGVKPKTVTTEHVYNNKNDGGRFQRQADLALLQGVGAKNTAQAASAYSAWVDLHRTSGFDVDPQDMLESWNKGVNNKRKELNNKMVSYRSFSKNTEDSLRVKFNNAEWDKDFKPNLNTIYSVGALSNMKPEDVDVMVKSFGSYVDKEDKAAGAVLLDNLIFNGIGAYDKNIIEEILGDDTTREIIKIGNTSMQKRIPNSKSALIRILKRIEKYSKIQG